MDKQEELLDILEKKFAKNQNCLPDFPWQMVKSLQDLTRLMMGLFNPEIVEDVANLILRTNEKRIQQYFEQQGPGKSTTVYVDRRP